MLFFLSTGKKRDLKAEEIEMVEKEMRDYDKTIKLSDQAHRSKMNQIRSDLSQKSELARYSTAIDRLCQDIEANVHQFRSKPIGPLGRHIKLTQEAARNDKLNSLLEIQLGQKNLKSFLVECKEDQRVLDNLMRKHWHLKAKQPMITTRKRLLHTYYILITYLAACILDHQKLNIWLYCSHIFSFSCNQIGCKRAKNTFGGLDCILENKLLSFH